MKTKSRPVAAAAVADTQVELGERLNQLTLWLSMALLVVVPLALSTAIYATYSLAKFVVLLVGASILALLLATRFAFPAAKLAPQFAALWRAKLVRLVCLLFLLMTISTLLGVSPVVSLFGTHYNHMGLLTRLCFLALFLSLIVGIGVNAKDLRLVIWAMVTTGFLASAYAMFQSLGVEPFVPRSLYTFPSPNGPIARVNATLGHSNYLGNFLLYTTPLAAALALATRGLGRIFAALTSGLGVLAIAASGTRGAWAGLLVGFVIFALLEVQSGNWRALWTERRATVLAVGAGSAVLLVGLLVFSPASRTIAERTQALMTEGAGSSGRLVLWRDSLKLLPSYAFIGSGPEGVRQALLATKSRELARLSPDSNNESSHNAYLDAAISYGLPGALVYLAIIIYALLLLWRARRRSLGESSSEIVPPISRLIITGIIASFAAVLTHNLFIFDQVATGLYFFAFLALAQALTNVYQASATTPATDKEQASDANVAPEKPRLRLVVVAVAFLGILAATWYAAGLVKADIAYKQLFNPASPVDYARLVALGERITGAPLPSGAYHYLFARGAHMFINNLPAAAAQTNAATAEQVTTIRTQSLSLAINAAEKSLARTNTPELNHSLLAALALTAGDVPRLHRAASEAVKWDPHSYYARWLLAEAHLARGENPQALREAEVSLELNPGYANAATVLTRAHGLRGDEQSAATKLQLQLRRNPMAPRRSIEELIAYARTLAQAGNIKKARRKLLEAIVRSPDYCPDAHRELAGIYEKLGLYKNAAISWETYARQAPERAAAEPIPAYMGNRGEAVKR